MQICSFSESLFQFQYGYPAEQYTHCGEGANVSECVVTGARSPATDNSPAAIKEM